jgi:hypothetical protein
MIRMNTSLYQITIKSSGPEKTTGPDWSNTDSGSKRGVQCKDSSILYLALLLGNYFNIK